MCVNPERLTLPQPQLCFNTVTDTISYVRITCICMAACIEGPTYANNTSDVSICPWSDEIHKCIFLKDPVPITDIKASQIRAHSDYIQAAITTCEDETSHDIPFFSLKFTDFGHPMHGDVFPSKLVEQRTQDEMNKHTILVTKCLGADTEFRIFYEVR